mmetsp:Transcript_78336/g.123355  ORF Transcript_78336/g.123355 Transcript_78336/m.123355 type:complete len:332 (-) Transcript_78336:73-1068(-)
MVKVQAVTIRAMLEGQKSHCIQLAASFVDRREVIQLPVAPNMRMSREDLDGLPLPEPVAQGAPEEIHQLVAVVHVGQDHHGINLSCMALHCILEPAGIHHIFDLQDLNSITMVAHVVEETEDQELRSKLALNDCIAFSHRLLILCPNDIGGQISSLPRVDVARLLEPHDGTRSTWEHSITVALIQLMIAHIQCIIFGAPQHRRQVLHVVRRRGRQPRAVVDVAVVEEEDVAPLSAGPVAEMLQDRGHMRQIRIQVRLMPPTFDPGVKVCGDQEIHLRQLNTGRFLRADRREVLTAVVEAPAGRHAPTRLIMATTTNLPAASRACRADQRHP